MDTKEILIKDEMMGEMSALVEKLKTEQASAMEKMEHRFMIADCSQEIDRLIEASFKKGYVEGLMHRVGDMDIKRASLLIRYHSHYLASNDSPVAGKELSEMLEKIADRIDEIREVA